MKDVKATVASLIAEAAERKRHTQGVGSPTAYECVGCRCVALASFARALAIPQSALASARVADAERVIGSAGVSISECAAILAMIADIEASENPTVLALLSERATAV